MPVFDYRCRICRRQKQVIWVCGYQPGWPSVIARAMK
jgi:hypothetical protein